MFSFSRKADYALIALGHLAGRDGQTVSAREIAETYVLPQALIMKILKALHHAGIVSSLRGVNGGYRLALDLHQVSLYQLIDIVRQIDRTRSIGRKRLPSEPPLLAVYSKLMRF